MGEYHHSIDEKQRLIIPSKFREELGAKVIVTRGLEDSLFVYSLNEWQQIVARLKTLPFTKKDARAFNRFFMSGATAIELDKQGRANIPSPLTSYANLSKKCVIVGTGDRLEIWNEDDFDAFMSSATMEMSDIAENLFEEKI